MNDFLFGFAMGALSAIAGTIATLAFTRLSRRPAAITVVTQEIRVPLVRTDPVWRSPSQWKASHLPPLPPTGS